MMRIITAVTSDRSEIEVLEETEATAAGHFDVFSCRAT
jgi:hypothetical protein